MNPKSVIVFGASGKVGRIVVKDLLDNGYVVRAFVHRTSPFRSSDTLKIIRGDVHDPVAINEALKTSDAVISCLGSWGTKDKDVLTSSMKNIIPAMEKQRITRIISLTGSAAMLPKEKMRIIDRLNHAALSIVGHKVLADAENHLRLLSDSHLEWTVIRSPVMKSHGESSYYLRSLAPMPFATIPRLAVAKAIVDQLDSSDFMKSAPHIIRPT